jgi:hypothetical protein
MELKNNRELKDRICYKCGSSHVAKVVPASALCVPEIRKDVEEGRAVTNCGCGGTSGSGIYRCLDCGFEWDHYMELSMLQELDAKK